MLSVFLASVYCSVKNETSHKYYSLSWYFHAFRLFDVIPSTKVKSFLGFRHVNSHISKLRFGVTKMRSLSSIGLGLSLVFGFLLLALMAELYYLLWWKRRIVKEHDYSSPTREFFYMFCFKTSCSSSSLSSTALNPHHICSFTETQVHEPQVQKKDNWVKQFNGEDEDSVDNEFVRLQTFTGPPRFLFTIHEETKEDLESDESKSRSRSLSDILIIIETPFLTPLDSPSRFTPPHSPRDVQNGFNPLYETSSDAEFNKTRSSPPPKFNFLMDEEEKVQKTEMLEDEGESDDEEENESFITLIVDENRAIHHPNYTSTSSSQVLPLAASLPTFRSSPSIKNLNL